MSNAFEPHTPVVLAGSPERSAQNEGTQYMLMALAGQEYGVKLTALQEVMRYQPRAVAPVPNTPGWLEGVFSLRGTIISVVSLRAFLGLPRTGQGHSKNGADQSFGIEMSAPRMLVIGNGDLLIGVVVDDIKGVLFVQPEAIQPVPAGLTDAARPYLDGVYHDPETGQTTRLFNPALFLNSSALVAFNVQLV